MKVIHIESGLGNQMLSYCEYLAMKKMNPNDKVYIETIIYDIPECNNIICQWNGFELERIFGINAPNIREYFTDEQWQQIMSDIRSSEFWLRNLNYPVHFSAAFNRVGLNIINIRGDFEKGGLHVGYDRNRKLIWKDKFRDKDWWIALRYAKGMVQDRILSHKVDYKPKLFVKSDENLFTGQQLDFKRVNSGIEDIDSEIRQVFQFPSLTDDKSINAVKNIQECNSVAIHARRGDMLKTNYHLYRFGYFRRAVSYIRKKVEKPVFFIFCDPDSVEWAKQNENIFGLNFKHDEVHFIDWNKGENSFRDMQIMAQCKHQIITNSSFGWWGAWLNSNPDKITISPSFLINTTKTL